MRTFVQHRIFNHGFILLRAENNANSRIVVRALDRVFVKADIHVHLTYVLVRQFTGFQIDKDKTLQYVVVKHKINIEVLGLGSDPLLTRNEGKTLPQFQHERLQLPDDGGFQLRFTEAGIIL